MCVFGEIEKPHLPLLLSSQSLPLEGALKECPLHPISFSLRAGRINLAFVLETFKRSLLGFFVCLFLHFLLCFVVGIGPHASPMLSMYSAILLQPQYLRCF